MPTQQELYNWKLGAAMLLGIIEIQDHLFRNNICVKCTEEMRRKRKCEDMGEGRTFCQLLVNARNKNKKIKKMELIQTLSSPFIRNSTARKVAETLYCSSKS